MERGPPPRFPSGLHARAPALTDSGAAIACELRLSPGSLRLRCGPAGGQAELEQIPHRVKLSDSRYEFYIEKRCKFDVAFDYQQELSHRLDSYNFEYRKYWNSCQI
ncbi:uncharacterized protein LRP34_000571 [Phaethornis superciliosus]